MSQVKSNGYDFGCRPRTCMLFNKSWDKRISVDNTKCTDVNNNSVCISNVSL